MKGEGATSLLEKAIGDRSCHKDSRRKSRGSAREHGQYELLGLGAWPAEGPNDVDTLQRSNRGYALR